MYKNFQTAYYGMINKVLKEGKEVTVRGLDMLEIIPGYFEIENPRDRLLNIDSRKKMNRYIFGELVWYLTGRDDCEFINKYSKVWAPLSDDGIHNNSAYGKFIFNPMPSKGFGVIYDGSNDPKYNNTLEFKSQWEFVKEVLKADPFSRQAVIHIKPVQMYQTKDTVCTYFLQFFVRDNKLDMIACMRSNDLFTGLSYDAFMFTFMQELMAAELGLEVGTYKHFASNMHIYKRNLPNFEEILKDDPNKETVQFGKIPSDFRTKDLPILLELEQKYWKEEELDKELINSLSTVSKQLLTLLTGEEYV